MTELVKRYALDLGVVAAGELGVKVSALHRPDPNGDWCRYEPRFEQTVQPTPTPDEFDEIKEACGRCGVDTSLLDSLIDRVAYHERNCAAALGRMRAEKAELRQRVEQAREHDVEWHGVFRGTDSDPRETGWCETGWCATCEREVHEGDGAHQKPRFDAPQLSREEVDLIEWLRCQVKHSYVAPGAIAASRLSKAKQLVARLRESLPIIRPEPPEVE